MYTTSSAESRKTVIYIFQSSPPFSSLMSEIFFFVCVFTGSGAVYSFDPVGSYEREACRAAGAAQSLVQPFLDNQVSYFGLFSSSYRPFPARCLQSTEHPIDLLQESGASDEPTTSNTSSVERCLEHRRRFIYKCDRTAHRGTSSHTLFPRRLFGQIPTI
jgi:hypothetical protein